MAAAPVRDASPLAGAGVLVTRPVRQAAAFAAKVAAVGGWPVVFPAIVILPPDDPAPLQSAQAMLASYDYVVFVSANAVEFGIADPAAWPSGLPALAPGPGTAEALHNLGLANVRFPTDRQDSEGLLAMPEFTEPAGKRVLVLRGDGGRELLARTLRGRGAMVDHVTCYRRDRPRDGAGLVEVFQAGRIDAVTVTSSEGLDNLWAIIDPATRDRWAGRPTFAPHPRIAAQARALGLTVVETAAGDAGLVTGLLEWFSTRH
ncbi:MAG: uroporphyrinogen-III synthase [Casimicrobiaceae bacterium]